MRVLRVARLALRPVIRLFVSPQRTCGKQSCEGTTLPTGSLSDQFKP